MIYTKKKYIPQNIFNSPTRATIASFSSAMYGPFLSQIFNLKTPEVHKVVTMKKNQHYKKYIKEHEIPSNNFARSKISVDSKLTLGRQSLH